MRFECIDKIIEKISSFQKCIEKYMLRQQELLKRNPKYNFPRTYYQSRSIYEEMRVKRLQLTRRKNRILTYMSFS